MVVQGQESAPESSVQSTDRKINLNPQRHGLKFRESLGQLGIHVFQRCLLGVPPVIARQ